MGEGGEVEGPLGQEREGHNKRFTEKETLKGDSQYLEGLLSQTGNIEVESHHNRILTTSCS